MNAEWGRMYLDTLRYAVNYPSMIIGEFLVMAGSFAVIFAILIYGCGIHKIRDDPEYCKRQRARYNLRMKKNTERRHKSDRFEY